SYFYSGACNLVVSVRMTIYTLIYTLSLHDALPISPSPPTASTSCAPCGTRVPRARRDAGNGATGYRGAGRARRSRRALTPPGPGGPARGGCGAPRAGSRVQRRHHVLDPRVVVEAVRREVLAVAGLLEAAVRHLRDQRDVGVDPHADEVQLLGHAHRAGVVLGPHRGGQRVLDAVGVLEGLVLVGEALDGDDRAEALLLDDLVVLLQAGDDGRRVEVAPIADPLAAGLHQCVGGQPLDEALDLLELAGVVQRAVQDVLVVGHAGLDVGGGLAERGHELVVDGLV